MAYIRFASVYRSFQDVSGFEKEIKDLLGRKKKGKKKLKIDLIIMSVNNLVSSNTMSSVKNIFQLTKNSGETVVFNENKLKASIVAALRSAGIEDNPISNQLVDEVIKKLGEELNYRENITTLDVREAVEIAFLERGLTKAAQDYHDYDKKNKEVEDLQIFLKKIKILLKKCLLVIQRR